MNDVRKYCKDNFHLNVYLDDFMNELEKLLKSSKTSKDKVLYCLKKEIKGLITLLNKKGYSLKEKKSLLFELCMKYMNKEMDSVVFESHPLKMISFDEAISKQYRLVDIMHRYFEGHEALEEGDYGCNTKYGRPLRTYKVEKILAEYFECEDACLIRGAGTGAIRSLCFAMLKKGDRVLIHDAPLYYTSELTMNGLGVELIRTDFNDFDNIRNCLKQGIDVIYIQRVRQKLSDSYDSEKLISSIRKIDKKVRIVVDENYAVNKVDKIAAAFGADASAFSLFKLLGIEGIGLIVGKKEIIDIIHKQNYSGGGQVQGPEASEILRSLVNNPVLLAVQNKSVDEIVKRLEHKEVRHVSKAIKANIEERIILVKLNRPMAKEVITEAIKLGALPYPVGSESRYEVQTLFYRVAKVMLDENRIYENYVIRINPMRSGPDTVIRILDEAINKVLKAN